MTSERTRWWPLLVLGAVLALVAITVVVRLERAPAAPPTSRVLLDESFDSGRLDTRVWNTCHWWHTDGCTIESNDELQWYLPEQVSVADGALRLTAEPDSYTNDEGKTFPYRSGMVTTGPTPDDNERSKVDFTYGTVEVRFKAPRGQGLWPAIWLLPSDEESRPEIDILEMLGQNPRELILHFHPEDRSADSPSKRVQVSDPDLASDWHTVGLEWTEGKLVYLLDGEPVWTVTGSSVPSEPMYLVMNLAVGGVYPGPPDSSTPNPATFEIDHVRITSGS